MSISQPLPSDSRNRNVIGRRRKNKLPDIDSKLVSLLAGIRSGAINGFSRNQKYRRFEAGSSKRGSNHIGVTKNGDNWQVLINTNLKKTYIGTYAKEKEAAICYDFYSIALHGTRAKLNFDYSPELVEEMVNHFFAVGKKFMPMEFINRI